MPIRCLWKSWKNREIASGRRISLAGW